jgi:quercetin dioxygenase-like cupin family protein
MARAGKEIQASQLGLRMVFEQVSADTDGEAFSLEVFVEPGQPILGKHMHPRQQERVEVLSGGLEGEVGGDAKVLGPGEASVVPPTVMHHWKSRPGAPTHLRVEFRPALRTEVVFETLIGLAAEGKVRRNGMPRLLQASVFIQEYGDELYFPIPGPIKAVLAKAVAPAARRLGYAPSYEKYSGGDPVPAARAPLR